jgi:hypothetical protein
VLLSEHFYDALKGNAVFAEEMKRILTVREFEDKKA